MKKYRMTFDSLSDALSGFCTNRRACAGCPFDKETTGESCADYCNAHPEEAVKIIGLEVVEVTPRLTEQELAICKALKAKWASKDDSGLSSALWNTKPSRMGGVYTASKIGPIARVKTYFFPSLRPGDLVNVEELLKEAEK